MKQLADWIKAHQIAAFFLLAFGINFGLWFVPGAVIQRQQDLLLPLVFFVACSPALAGIFISALTNTAPRQRGNKSFWTALLVAWPLALIIALAHNHLFNGLQLSPVVIGFFAVSVLPVAFVIGSAYSRNPAVRCYLSSLVRLRGVFGWSLLALVFVPALILLSVSVSSILNGNPLVDYPFPELNLSLAGLVVVKLLYQLFFFNAVGEEAGWRGFALPRLQARTSPLVAALFIALLWAPFHFFFWQAEGRPVMSLSFWVNMYIGHILLSIFIVWICNRARGSILVAGIAHASANTTFAFVGLETPLPWLAAALALILLDRMWQKLPAGHPGVYAPPGLPDHGRKGSDLDRIAPVHA